MKNMMDFCLAALLFWAVGYAWMFGESAGGGLAESKSLKLEPLGYRPNRVACSYVSRVLLAQPLKPLRLEEEPFLAQPRAVLLDVLDILVLLLLPSLPLKVFDPFCPAVTGGP